MSIRGRKTKKCPRCGNECLLSQAKCDECGLLFARVEEATNKAGKIRLARHQKEMVLYVRRCPNDVKKWKLIIITIFLGLFGGHYFYVGRWKLGLTMLCYFFAVLFMGVIFNAYFLTLWSGQFFSIFGPITGIYTLIWLNDITRVCFNRFKIPVSIITEQENDEFLEERKKQKALKKELKIKAKGGEDKKLSILSEDKEVSKKDLEVEEQIEEAQTDLNKENFSAKKGEIIELQEVKDENSSRN